MHVILIAAITADGYIARHSNEIVNWSLDLHLFKKQTMGFPVIMGSNTKKTLNMQKHKHRKQCSKKNIEDRIKSTEESHQNKRTYV